ncbi:hypothetical protein VR45_36915, partial [Streptomyces sp. NRRL S-495]
YRERVHAFAERWRQASWPPDTSEYALTGYPQLLRATGDARRLSTLGTDAVRHDRLWQTTGTDAPALAEIADAFRLEIANPSGPDLTMCLRLSLRRDTLHQQVANTPDDLIVTWAHLGQIRRALTLTQAMEHRRAVSALLTRILATAHDDPDTVALVTAQARSITDPDQQAKSLVAVAEVVAAAGQHKQAADLAREAADVAHTIADSDQQPGALVSVAEAMVRAGQHEQALNLTRTITNPYQQAQALARVAEAMARAGQH